MSKFNLKEFFGISIGDLVQRVGEAIDLNVTSKEEKLKAKAEISKILTDFSEKGLDVQKEIILTEMKGNRYQRSWRPSLMYMSMFIIFSTWFIFPLINIWVQQPELTNFISELKTSTDFWDIIKLGVGAFGVGRTIEKVTTDIVNNVDVKLNKK